MRLSGWGVRLRNKPSSSFFQKCLLPPCCLACSTLTIRFGIKQLSPLAFLADTAHCLQYVHCRWRATLWVGARGKFHPCNKQRQAEICWQLRASHTDLWSSLCSRCCCFFKRKRKKTAQRHKWPVPPRSPQALGTLTRLHPQLLPFLIGRDSSVGEGGDPNQKEEKQMPPEGASAGSQGPVGQWPPLPAWGSEQVPEPLVLHCLPLGLPGWLSFLLFTVKVSFTKTQGLLFSPLPLVYLLLVLAPPSTLSSLKANELKALSAEGAWGAGGAAKKVGGRCRPRLEKNLLRPPGVSGSMAPSSSVPVQPPSRAGHGVQVTPSFPLVKLHCRTQAVRNLQSTVPVCWRS